MFTAWCYQSCISSGQKQSSPSDITMSLSSLWFISIGYKIWQQPSDFRVFFSAEERFRTCENRDYKSHIPATTADHCHWYCSHMKTSKRKSDVVKASAVARKMDSNRGRNMSSFKAKLYLFVMCYHVSFEKEKDASTRSTNNTINCWIIKSKTSGLYMKKPGAKCTFYFYTYIPERGLHHCHVRHPYCT